MSLQAFRRARRWDGSKISASRTSLALIHDTGGNPRMVRKTPSSRRSSRTTVTKPVRRHWMRLRISLMGGHIFLTDSKMSEWKTISHWTRRSGVKKELACTGNCNLSFGPAGRLTEDLHIEEVSSVKSMRRSSEGISDQLY